MGNVNTILNERLKKGDQSSKMAIMARQSAEGNLSSFSGIFSLSELSMHEKDFLNNLLQEYALNKKDVTPDLQTLISITSEVKGINNQAALLHGERIKRAHGILAKYRDGAFTAWLIATYGNRQTPYNFLQYYEFYEALPKLLRTRIELMPRQAIYTLASREGNLEKKQKLIENYNGETKVELLRLIREVFPLEKKDKRAQNIGENTIQELSRLCKILADKRPILAEKQKAKIEELLKIIHKMIL